MTKLAAAAAVAADGDLYRAAPKIYPRETDGRFQSLRRAAVIVLLGLYYVMPWLAWNGRGNSSTSRRKTTGAWRVGRCHR